MALLIVLHAWSWSLLVLDHPVEYVTARKRTVCHKNKTQYTASQLMLEIEFLIWKVPM